VIITNETVNRLQGIVKLGSDEWYLKEIEEENARKGYQNQGESSYTIYTLRGYAEADYIYLGLYLKGAPDEDNRGDPERGIEPIETIYPPRFHYQPHWLRFDPWVTDFYTLKLYQWIKTCYLEGTTLHFNSTLWYSSIITKELEIESYKILQPFRKPKVFPTYRPSVQVDLDYLTYLYQRNFHNHTIDTIELVLHPVENYFRSYLRDSRPIPCYKRLDSADPNFEFIEVGFIQWYLSKRILEWIAFGGERLLKTGFHNARRTGNRAFLREFYWDLWKDIDNLREEALAAKTSATYLQELWKKYKSVGNI